MGSEISQQIWKWEIVNPDDPDHDKGAKLLNYCIVIDPSQVCKISNEFDLLKWVKVEFKDSVTYSCQVIYSQFGLAIHQNDHQARRRFVEWAQNEIAVVPDFHKRIFFSDEAHFWLNGYVNKQNCRIWSEANPQVYVETPLHPEKLTVWCALWAARATIDLLKDTFGDHLISRFGPVNWPPRYCDLTPLDYFLWGYVKSLVYADKPQTLDHLEDNIRCVIADIRPEMLEKVIENWTSRLDYIRASRGSHMPEIIFKMTATAGSDVVQSGRPIFDYFFQHLWPYIGNNTVNVVFQMVKRLWLIRIDQ
ncbi:uncharacterized protein TNCV_5093351 [Trichonephila clavipes]|nr:uncharacterized protein TNCV_5093351 [Trichonephila clavipes]